MHWMPWVLSLAVTSTGRRRLARMPMMAMTTSNSISVNPAGGRGASAGSQCAMRFRRYIPELWCHASPFVNRYKRPRREAGVFRGGADEAVVGALLHDVRGPAGSAGDDEQRREHRRGNSAKEKCRRAVEIEIREEIFFAPHDGFYPLGNCVNAGVAARGGQFFCPPLDDLATGIGGF